MEICGFRPSMAFTQYCPFAHNGHVLLKCSFILAQDFASLTLIYKFRAQNILHIFTLNLYVHRGNFFFLLQPSVFTLTPSNLVCLIQSFERQMQDSKGDTNLDVNSPNLHHEKWSSSCCFPLLETISYCAWYYLFAVAEISSPRHTEPCWTGDRLKSCCAKQRDFNERHKSKQN